MARAKADRKVTRQLIDDALAEFCHTNKEYTPCLQKTTSLS